MRKKLRLGHGPTPRLLKFERWQFGSLFILSARNSLPKLLCLAKTSYTCKMNDLAKS